MIIRHIFKLLVALFAMLFVATAAAAQPEAAQPAPSISGVGDTGSAGYILGRDDVIQVGLLGRSDFGGRARVQADGTIQLNFIGKIPAADRTTSELAETIGEALKKGGYFADPVVTIEVVGFASRYNGPGYAQYQYDTKMANAYARLKATPMA